MGEVSAPQITTIIPTYRRPKLLRRAIRSVLAQTYPHIQVCVYDNASGDETQSVVAELASMDTRVKYHCHPENIGAYPNFQFGLQRVDTPYFSFLSDDDVLLPEFYRLALEGLRRHPDAMFSVTDVVIVDYRYRVMEYKLRNHTDGYYDPPNGLVTIFAKGNLTWTGILFRREVKDVVGLLDGDIGAPSDTDFIYRTAARCPYVLVKRPGAVFVYWGQDINYFQSQAGLRKMISNIENSGVPADVLRPIERLLVRRYQRQTRARCLYFVKRQDRRNALALARELNAGPKSTPVDAMLEKLIEHRSSCALLGGCIRAVRSAQVFLLDRLGARRSPTPPGCPASYLASDEHVVQAKLRELREESTEG
jgi:hypothetical protein